MYCPVISITGEKLICVGTTTTLFPTSGGTWTSNNPTIASVTDGGIVTGLADGTATFTFHNPIPACEPTVVTEAIQVVSSLPLWATIAVSEHNVCAGTEVIFVAIPSYDAPSTSYQWKNKGVIIMGANAPIYTYIPVNGDIISCEVSSSLPCASPSSIDSNSIIMKVSTPGKKPSITIKIK